LHRCRVTNVRQPMFGLVSETLTIIFRTAMHYLLHPSNSCNKNHLPTGPIRSQNSSVIIVTRIGWTIEKSQLNSSLGQESYATMSSLALGLT
jgi:hypothetical protein